MTHEPPRTSQPQLVRAIGRWSMVALAVNSILGSGIFGLPSVVAGLVGQASPAAVLIAGAGMAGDVALHPPGASPVPQNGGPQPSLGPTIGKGRGPSAGWGVAVGW